ncbi:MAG: nitrogen regulation protein NR(II) [Burkholderiales bacterium]|nr:nitrogen regulation protein NR(II) [Burkholderiales bacterium]
MTPAALSGLDLLAAAVVLVDERMAVHYMNPAAENLFELSSKNVAGMPLDRLFADDAVLAAAMGYARAHNSSYTEHDFALSVAGRGKLHLSCTVTPIEMEDDAEREGFLLEFRHIEQQLKIAREERILDQSQANRELIRNLAHEIKNPLGGIRGAAQLLDRELERPNLHEYTQVIMKEADRLQSLMDRLLTPHRLPQPTQVNIHEVLERVRSVILAEYPQSITVRRDYDTSLPQLKGDREQLIQAVLNIVRNAAQALRAQHQDRSSDASEKAGEIRLRTRIARQVTLARRRYRYAIAVEITDNGPGIPEAIQERIFYPLVSGRDGGTGLGLTLAQNFINQHHGTISFESAPGSTAFTILLPVEEAGIRESGTGNGK